MRRSGKKSRVDKLIDRGVLAPVEETKAHLMKDPEFRRAYDELGAEFDLVRSLIELRNRKGLTQHRLAELAGTKQPSIARIESGRYRGMSLATLERLAKALDARLVVRFEEGSTASHSSASSSR